MRKFLFILPALFVIGCSSKSGFKYSQDIVAKERSLTPFITKTDEDVSRFLTAQEYDSIRLAGESMESRVQEKIDEIDKLPLPDAKYASEFKSETLEYFRYIKSLFTGYKKLGSAATDEERQEVLTELRDIVNHKDDVLKKMQDAQAKYAKENNFKLEGN